MVARKLARFLPHEAEERRRLPLTLAVAHRRLLAPAIIVGRGCRFALPLHRLLLAGGPQLPPAAPRPPPFPRPPRRPPAPAPVAPLAPAVAGLWGSQPPRVAACPL